MRMNGRESHANSGDMRGRTGPGSAVTDGDAAGATHTIVEPPTVTLSEPDRHAPADGATEITVTVTPRDADGAPRTAIVTIELDPTLSAGAWTGPATATGSTVTRTLRAPATAAQDRIVVALDGVPIGVAPRVWWDAP